MIKRCCAIFVSALLLFGCALAEAPRADGSGLTAEARLTDTADLGSTIFFVKY